MGVKELWNILSPLCERRPLFELVGKVIAIDLSCWIVDSQTVTNNVVQPKMYLRNLYFRTAFLLTHGIIPVFVLEGKPPALKHKTIEKRNKIRSGSKERKTTRKGVRTNFNRILTECRDLLSCMGIACIQGEGEAEAMCAYLNHDGLVDGCISQDSDCFLYGAKVVYKNFCMSVQGNRAGTGRTVDEYRLEKIENTLNIGRNKMIALALLCGCDYNEGVNGVGKEAALKFFKTTSDSCVLDRIKAWKTDRSFEKLEAELSNPNLCTSCGHVGKLQKHTKSGCIECGTVTKCKDTYKKKRALLMSEIQIRKKTLIMEDFPDQELIDEFLIRKHSVPPKLDLEWKQPQIEKYIDFVERHLSWEPQYAFEKIFPLVTRWQLRYLPNISPDMRLSIRNLFIPERIKKVRRIKSVASYEIIWTDTTGIWEKLQMYYEVSDKENNDDEVTSYELITIEPQDAVQRCYPELVESFETERNKQEPQKRTVTKRQENTTKDTNVDNVEDANAQKKASRKPRKKIIKCKNNRKIDEFVPSNQPPSLEESFEKMSITPKRSKQCCDLKDTQVNANVDRSGVKYSKDGVKRPPQLRRVLELERSKVKLDSTLDRMFLELSPDDFTSETEDTDLNMTGVIERICNKYTFQYEFDNNSTSNAVQNDLSSSSVALTNDKDPVEAEEAVKCDFTEHDRDVSITKDTVNDSPDEFDDIESYVPICERIQTRSKKDESEKSEKFSIRLMRCTLGFDGLMNDTDVENLLL